MFVMTSGGPLNATDVLGTYSYTLSFKQYEFSLGSATRDGTVLLSVCHRTVLSAPDFEGG